MGIGCARRQTVATTLTGTAWCRTGVRKFGVSTNTQLRGCAYTTPRGPSGHHPAYPPPQRQATQAGPQTRPGSQIQPTPSSIAQRP